MPEIRKSSDNELNIHNALDGALRSFISPGEGHSSLGGDVVWNVEGESGNQRGDHNQGEQRAACPPNQRNIAKLEI